MKSTIRPLMLTLMAAMLLCLASTRGRTQADDPAGNKAKPAAAKVELRSLSWNELEKKVLTNPKAKLIVMDVWATWCGTCKENFPHLVELHKKYADKGLSCVSLSVDDPTDKRAVADAVAFLKEKNAVFTNVLLNEEQGVAFEKLEVGAIPAVFAYDPSGKQLARFTLDDVDNQFTYEQVEEFVKKALTK
jgi:thiol-disulfide isomerase/thioredoxin